MATNGRPNHPVRSNDTSLKNGTYRCGPPICDSSAAGPSNHAATATAISVSAPCFCRLLMPRFFVSCSLTQSSQKPTPAKPAIKTIPGNEKWFGPSKRIHNAHASTMPDTTNKPPIVGVPFLWACNFSSVWLPVPSIRSPMPWRCNQRITRGPHSTAIKNAVIAAPAVRVEM